MDTRTFEFSVRRLEFFGPQCFGCRERSQHKGITVARFDLAGVQSKTGVILRNVILSPSIVPFAPKPMGWTRGAEGTAADHSLTIKSCTCGLGNGGEYVAVVSRDGDRHWVASRGAF